MDMTRERLQKFLDRVSYKPDTLFKCDTDCRGNMFVYIIADTIDVETDQACNFTGHQAFIPEHADEEYVLRELRFVAYRWETHEVDEFLQVDGFRPYNPHNNVLTA